MTPTAKVQGALAFLVMAGFFAILWALLILKGEGTMRDALLIMVGALGAAFGAVVNFYFGSSSGSQAKDALLAEKVPP